MSGEQSRIVTPASDVVFYSVFFCVSSLFGYFNTGAYIQQHIPVHCICVLRDEKRQTMHVS